MKMPLIFVTVFIVTLMTACGNTTTPDGATATELCRQWGDSLATRSRLDTEQTQAEIQESYARFALACPRFEYLVP